MFGPRIGTVFASRWKALWWSTMVLLTAYCTVPSAEQSKSAKAGQSQEVKDAEAAVQALEALNDVPAQE